MLLFESGFENLLSAPICYTTETDNVSQEPPLPKDFTTRVVHAAIINHYFQPPTAEPKLLLYGFSKDCLEKGYNLPFVTTLETKLQNFQYKIIHNILPTRYSLSRINLYDYRYWPESYALFTRRQGNLTAPVTLTRGSEKYVIKICKTTATNR